MIEKVWMRPPEGDPVEVEATPENLTPLMVQGWRKCEPPPPRRERKGTAAIQKAEEDAEEGEP